MRKFRRRRKRFFDLGKRFGEYRRFADEQVYVEKLGFHGVVQVRGVVSDLINAVDQLRFERRPAIEQIFAQFRKSLGGVVTRVFDDSFAYFKSEI